MNAPIPADPAATIGDDAFHAYLASLLQSAAALRPPPEAAADMFESLRETLAEEHNRRMSARPDIDRLIGAGNLDMMLDNSRNFCRFMSAMFKTYDPDMMVHTVLWVFRTYRSHGFQIPYWPAHLDTFVEIARARLPPETFRALEPFFHWLIVNIPAFVRITDTPLKPPIHHAPNAAAEGSR